MNTTLAVLFASLAFGCSHRVPPRTTHPKTILVIRHAEKPVGIDADLSPVGVKRAEALPELFARTDPLPTPDFIFAAMASKKSNRSVETVTPLAKALHLAIHSGFENDDFARLAGELFANPKYEGKTVLICWHHGKIPELLHSLGIDPKPRKIDDSVFDRIWVVTFDGEGKVEPLVERPQSLMPGDGKD